jgi:hypothetical protein
MSTSPTQEFAGVLDWADPTSRNFGTWSAYDRNAVTKIVLGTLAGSQNATPLAKQSLPNLAERLAEFPNLTHLYLWRVEGLRALPRLPDSLRCLDIRGCPLLARLSNLPAGLKTLVLQGCPKLAVMPEISTTDSGGTGLTDLSVIGGDQISRDWISNLIERSPKLRRLAVSACPQLEGIEAWPVVGQRVAPELVRIDLNDCPALQSLPDHWPENLRRLGLKGATTLKQLPDFSVASGPPGGGLDYLDLRETTALKSLPENLETLRTLFLKGSGLNLPPELFGESEDSNVATQVLAYLREAGRGTVVDHEVKVILLGNGRCGKSSLLRRLIDDTFDPKEKSTHGIRLRTKSLEFHPVDDRNGTKVPATLNFWDFAGQDLYHNTHRSFLQSKAVYIRLQMILSG